MLSRVADNLYWFARYVRRAENTARLVGVGSQLQLDLPTSVRFRWRPLIDAVGAGPVFAERHPVPEAPSDVDVIRFLLLDEANPSSLRRSVHTAREILRSIRDALPSAVWETLTDLHVYLEEDGERHITRRHRIDLVSRVVDACLKIAGLLGANVSRDVGYQFLQLGTAIEQADMTTRIIDAGASGLVAPRHPEDQETFRNLQWMAVLSSLAAYQNYRRHVRQRVTGEHALRFLLQNPDFPRSVYYCLVRAHRVLAAMPPRAGVERHVQRLLGLIRNADPAALAERNAARFMDDVQLELATLHNTVAGGYFHA
jgi:uncharacterized alpha-E superfamily protein